MNLLPQNWIDEFNATRGPSGKLQYTCRKCFKASTFYEKNDAKRHARGAKHRQLFKQEVRTSTLIRDKTTCIPATSGSPLQMHAEVGRGDAVETRRLEWEEDVDCLDDPGDLYQESMPSSSLGPAASAVRTASLRHHPDKVTIDVSSADEGHSASEESQWFSDFGLQLPSSDSDDRPVSTSESTSHDGSTTDEDNSSANPLSSDDDADTSTLGMENSARDFTSTSQWEDSDERSPGQGSWVPYPNQTYAILDAIANFPRHPLSDDLLEIILWSFGELGVKGVPSLQVFRTFQTTLRKSEMFGKARAYESVLGNKFTSNDVLQSMRLDMSNPRVRSRIAFYPEDPISGTSELRHSQKWFSELPDSMLTPMWASRHGTHFYIFEFARTMDGSWVVPLRWFTCAGGMHMFYYPVYNTDSGLEVDASERLRGPASVLAMPLPEIRSQFLEANIPLIVAPLTQAKFDPSLFNPWRVRAAGRPCYKYFILFGGDDVSGNRSKSWNKHYCYYYCAAGLPLSCLNQEYFIHFISSSQFAGPTEQLAASTDRVRSVKDTGVVCFDCLAPKEGEPGFSDREALVIPDLFVGTGDSPWQSELSSHSGDGCPCRFCEMGGNVKARSSDAGFLSIMEPGIPRTQAKTKNQIIADLETATIPRKGTDLANTQQSTGVVDSLAQTVITSLVEEGKQMFNEKTEDGRKRYTATEIREQLIAKRDAKLSEGSFINSLLDDEAFDPHKDTALGRLHLVLLGFAKYFWSASLPAMGRKLTNAEKEALNHAEAVLLSLSQDGLGERSIRADYVMRYRGSLVGRHLHSITQLGVFMFGQSATPVLRQVWVTLSRLCAMLFTETIDNMVPFTTRLQVVVDDFFDAVVQYNPTWVMYKAKFHHLAHTVFFVLRFGPLGLIAEDRFEKFHAVWRHSSIFSNHHSASRDSATHFNALDATKHILSGGFFEFQGIVIQASSEVLNLFTRQPAIQARFGLRSKAPRTPGHVTVHRKAERLSWSALGALNDNGLHNIWPPDLRQPAHEYYKPAKSFVSIRGDIVKPGHFVWRLSPASGVARVLAVWSRDRTVSRSSGPTTVVRVEIFAMTERHQAVDCPCLTKEDTYLLEPKDVLFVLNVQHDCFKHQCSATTSQYQIQERQQTNLRSQVIEHRNDTDYILNIFVLHHYDELQRLIPSKFIGPASICSAEERRDIRLAAAVVLRSQIAAHEKSKGAVRQARAGLASKSEGTSTITAGHKDREQAATEELNSGFQDAKRAPDGGPQQGSSRRETTVPNAQAAKRKGGQEFTQKAQRRKNG